MAVSLEELSKALVSLEEALTVEKTDISRDASIQRFEFCVELAWKSARKVMGTSTTAPKQVIREMAQSGLIEDVEFWLKSIDQRNLSSHTYIQKLAEEVYAFAKSFLNPAKQLLTKLQGLLNSDLQSSNINTFRKPWKTGIFHTRWTLYKARTLQNLTGRALRGTK